MEHNTLDELLTIKEVAEYLKCSRQHVYNMINRGELITNKVGGLRRMSRGNLLAYIKQTETRVGSN